MSRQLALDTVYLKSTPRLAHTEYSLEYHTDYIRTKTGLDPSDPEAVKRLYNLWNIDFIWHTNDGLHGDWAKFGRTTDMGHAEYAADGSDKHDPAVCPFNSPEEVWSFDAVSEYGLPDFNEQVAVYENIIQQARQEYPDQLFTGVIIKLLYQELYRRLVGRCYFWEHQIRQKWKRFLIAFSDIRFFIWRRGQRRALK